MPQSGNQRTRLPILESMKYISLDIKAYAFHEQRTSFIPFGGLNVLSGRAEAAHALAECHR